MDNINFHMVDQFFQPIISSLPKILGAIGLFILGFIIAKVIRKLTKAFLVKIKVDMLADKLDEIELFANTKIKLVISSIVAGIIYYLLLVVFTIAITDMLNLTTVSYYLTTIINYLPQAFTAIAFLIVGVLFADFIRKMVYSAAKSIGIPSSRIISTVLFYFLFINVFISALTQAGIDTEFIQSNITMIIGGVVVAFALGYGIASKDVMSSILASYYNKRFKEGDTITIESYTGQIVSISNTDFVLKADNKMVVIPLSKISKESIVIHASLSNDLVDSKMS
ncbi:MAG: mechanosensitive ion channel domain-containing protein [Saprospiraceae bacterium]